MKYLELKNMLDQLTDKQLEDEVVVYLSESAEYYQTVDDYPILIVESDHDILKENQLYIVI